MKHLQLHMALECIGFDADDQLFRIPGENPDTIHRVYLARMPEENRFFFRAGLANDLRCELKKLEVSVFFKQPAFVQSLLAEDGLCDEIHIGRSYVFPAAVSPAMFPDAEPMAGESLAGWSRSCIRIDGEVVSFCVSSRENAYAAEAWVKTEESFRGRGYARQVTAAWAHSVAQRGKVPFYSHRWDNSASQAVARSLGLVEYLQDAGYA